VNPVDVLKYGHLTFLNALSGVPRAEWETPGVCGVWSVKNIVAHLASYELVLIDILGGFLEAGPMPYLDRYRAGQAFNDAEVDARRSLNAGETLAEYNDAQARVMSLIPRISEDVVRRPGTLPWYGEEYALDDFICYQYYGHKREHSAQVNVFRDELNRRA